MHTDPSKFFAENLRFLGASEQQQVQTDPEKYNLYCGLLALSRQIATLQSDLSQARHQLAQIQQSIGK